MYIISMSREGYSLVPYIHVASTPVHVLHVYMCRYCMYMYMKVRINYEQIFKLILLLASTYIHMYMYTSDV